jgi:SAM-dependent methyltransferase
MLNWAARYFPIVRVLKRHLNETDSVLEIGSGYVGIGGIYPHAFIGCDVNFEFEPRPPMIPVLATAMQLPFRNGSFDAVIASDVLEHVPPDRRRLVILEALRVARKLTIFGFPSGADALEYDKKLAEVYDRRRLERPMWLQEHIRHGFPAEDIFEDLKSGWSVTSFGNENLEFHFWVMTREMSRAWDYGFRRLLSALPRMVEKVIRRADREPFYRKIVVIERRSNSELPLVES